MIHIVTDGNNVSIYIYKLFIRWKKKQLGILFYVFVLSTIIIK